MLSKREIYEKTTSINLPIERRQGKEGSIRRANAAQLADDDDVFVRSRGLGSTRGPRSRPRDHLVGGRGFVSRQVPPLRARLPDHLDPLLLLHSA